ncbi:type II toxin-antitoxin system RelE/ParE family toxin [Brucella anthropi]
MTASVGGLQTLSGYLKYAVVSHVIYFREHENTLLVVRILHGRMDVGRHM